METEEGLRTGVLVYHDIRERWPVMPIVVLTNVSDEAILGEFEGDVSTVVRSKFDTPPRELVGEVRNLLMGQPLAGGA